MCHQFILLATILLAATPLATPQALPGCPDRCGNLSIPYPFGTKEGCYLNENFSINCNATNVAFHANTSIQVLNISVIDGELRVSTPVAYDCYDVNGNSSGNYVSSFSESRFPISYTKNKFTAVGCDTYAFILGEVGHNYATGCIGYCDKIEDVINGSCDGIGCCQTSIPRGVWDFEASVESFYNHHYVFNYNPCSYSFLVELNSYNFSTSDLLDLQKVQSFPIVLDWAIGNDSCDVAQKHTDTYACKGNSECYDSDNGPGYRCNCSKGYKGNPYLVNGCQDVDECSDASLNQCTYSCTNAIGNYTCSCPKGYHGDGRKDGTSCMPDKPLHVIAIIGVGTGLAFLSIAFCLTVLGIQKVKMMKLRKEYFKQNGGLLLQQLLFKSKSSVDAAKIFMEDELKKATNNFSKNMVIGQGGYGVVYKGILSDNRTVAIKKAKAIDKMQIEQFVNEVIVLSQISHPNAVKLLGCCLETPVPLLVYEFITNGTLFNHLHNPSCARLLPWETRLRIAKETAGTLAYMHSVQIIHRDVKSANILLDDDFTTKVSDFGVSRVVPFDEDQISTLVQGTLGYMDPEYFQTGILTEKSDVYSFGVLLVELLTGKKAICSECEERSLVLYFISALKQDMLFEVLEERVKMEGDAEQLQGVAEIARSCLRLEGDKRPTMRKVVEEIEMLRPSGKEPQMNLQHSFDGLDSSMIL